jgi:ribosome-interacting GTPase 1
VISTARTCDVIIIVLDALKPFTHRKLIEHELEGVGIRLNKKPPAIVFNKKEKGGIAFSPNPNGPTTFLDEETVKAILAEYKIHNADVKLFDDCTDEDLIDVIEGNRIYTPAVYAVNKMDSVSLEELQLMDDMKHYVMTSSEKEWNLDGLLEKVWEYLDLIRVYTMPRGTTPNFDEPIILHKKACTVEDFCNKLHKTIIRTFKHALIWGTSSKHRPQRVGKDHVLEDEDVVQIQKAHGT